MSYNQRETPILAELCTLLVEDVYGELAARVYSILARHGRQTLAAVARASYLNGRQIKYGLVILLQQHLVFHSGNDASVTYYEIDWQNSYALVRLGKVAKLVEDRFGKKAANVMSNLLALGHTRIADLKDAYFPPETASDDESDDGVVNGAGLKRKRTNGTQANGTATKTNGVVNGVPSELDDAKPHLASLVNGGGAVNGIHKTNGTTHEPVADDAEQDDDDIGSVDELYEIIQRLIQRGWVRTVTESQYLSPGDMHDMLQQEAIEQENAGVTPTGTKDKDRVHRATLSLKRQMRDDWLTVPKFSQKRQAEDYSGSNKRVKISGANNWATPSVSSEDNLVIRVNPEKIAVAMRTEHLVQLVEQRLGSVTAGIYQTMLRMLESNIPRCYEEWPEPPLPGGEPPLENTIDHRLLVTARDVAKKLNRDLDICEGLDPHAIVHITKKGHVDKYTVLTHPTDPSRLSLDERTLVVDKHIQLLAEDPIHFVTWHSRAGHSQWHVEFEEIAKQMIQSEVENTISARKGALGVKLIRALRKKGKLDERATCNAMMMPANDIRGIINDLTVQGFVQTQEIPKVERREAKHSLHLVWYDRQRAREKLLHDTYKGMVRILQRVAFEREKVQPLLSKAERSDVIGNEEKWLSKGELDALKKWKEVQEKLLLQLFREDDLVATLRDFHGPLVSV
ncbi:DNA directed RNA polymeras-like protein III subunit Rpc82 [Cucurbitaria berberidis CBS 394.84]|uniref:DNA-directed RNA polymerase III subunit RPC3 n=1 Tax=Cucurbitaria berberidis CBS 394.84 TaxID=1168544 RepID=A0A9P4GGI6_9PLEO|nr:DNA directed RNA polymeras-like protein III subunit Rpc82 [Cucurbitaria berberidis CBS 394.84]KAF1844841.1 DNA directed RNA polymeras-like protein III subunit Rpc82 [Cucurbitaria berberidis CBS 394.84]